MDKNMVKQSIMKAVWLSYDLGIGGDYAGLYKWLDNHKAVECGNSVAFFKYQIEQAQLDNLASILSDDIQSIVSLRSGDRLYIVYSKKEQSSSGSIVKGKFIYGRRKSNPWEGYGDSEPQTDDIGE